MLHFSRRALSMSGLGVVLTGAILVACSDSDPLGPRPPQPEPPVPVDSYLLDCTVNISSRDLRCEPANGAGSGAVGGASRSVNYGGQNQYVTLSDDDAFAIIEDTLNFGVRIKNLLPQAIGTTDGVTEHAEGIRVFFGRGPNAVSGMVVPVAPTADITGTAQPYFQADTILQPQEESAFLPWKFDISGITGTTAADSVFTFGVAISTKVKHPLGWVDASADSVHMPVSGADTVTYLVRKDFVGRPHGNQAVTISVADPAVASVTRSNDSIFITGLAKGATTVTLDHADATIDDAVIKVVVNSAPTVGTTAYDAIGNLTLSVPAPGLKSLITDGDGAADASNHSIVAGTFPTTRGGSVTLNADGSFTYLNAEDVTGADTFEFTATDGLESATGQVTINVGNPVFYVQPGFSGPTSDGTHVRPFKTLAAAVAKAGDGDTILVLTGTGSTAEGGTVALDPGQVVIGQGHVGAVERLLNGATVSLLATGGTHPSLNGTLQLAAGATVRGIHVNASSGAALTGNASATLTGVNLTAANGPAINLTGGTLAASFGNVSATNPAGSGVILSGVAGNVSAVGGSITGGTGSAFQVSGGSVAVTWGGSITQDAAGALLEVTGDHTGTLTFQNGTLNANGGTGLQFTNADGTYHLNGSLDLSGGDAGIDIGASSIGTINVTPAAGHTASILSPTGVAVAVAGGSATLNFNGNVTQASNAALLNVSGGHTGALTFANGTLNATAGNGLQFSDADGTYKLNGVTTLGGGDAGIDVLANSGGTIDVVSAPLSPSSITNPSGPAVQVANAAASLKFSYAGNIEKTNAGVGIQITNNAAGAAISFTGGSKVLSTGAANAVEITTDDASVTFAGGGLAITTTTGQGFRVQEGGTVEVTGSNNTINTTGAVAVQVVNTSSGTSGINFRTVNAGGAANAVVLNNVPGAGFQIAGTGAAGTGGTLQATNTAIVLSGVDSTRFAGVNVQAPIGFNASTFGGLALETASVTSTNGAALGLTTGRLHVNGGSVSATGGAALSATGVALAGTLSSLSASTTSGNAVSLTNSTGSLTASGGSLAVSGAGGVAVLVSGNTSVGFTYGGSITQDANAALLDVTGGHTGTLAFNTGTVNANSGTGLQFTDADGVYNFNGSLDLSGGNAGIDIATASSGDVNVVPAGGHSAQIVSPTGSAIAIAGGSGDLTYNGTVTQATASQALLSVAGGHSGVVTFASGTLTASNGTGLQFDNADGTYHFDGTVNLSNSVGGADAGIDVTNNSDGEFQFSASSTISNPANQVITVQNGVSPLSFTYAGSFTKNNNSVTGILVQNNTGGTIAFTGDPATETKLLSTGTANAVNLLNNTGATVLFAGGGLSITTGTGNGFNATGGGTVQVTNNENTISSAGGVALNVQNTTIGASGLRWKSISANGGTSGIVLSNTGNLNGVEVVGNGTANSGGTIQNTTSHGVSLSSMTNPRFARMNIQNTAGSGVNGTGVTHFTFTDGTINNSGTGLGADASNIDFYANAAPGTENNLSGTVTIRGNTLSNAYYHGIDIFNYAGTVDSLGISDNVITTPTSPASSLGHGIRVIAFGSTGNVAKITRATINNNQITNVPTGVGLQVQCGNSSMTGPATACGTQGSATDAVRITNNTIRGQSSANRMNAEGLIALVNGVGQGNFLIQGNTVRYTSGTAISHSAFGNAQVTSTISGNTIEAHNINLAQGIGIGTSYTTASGAAETPSLTSTISGNQISQTNGSGILAVANDVNGTVRVKILNNNVAAPLGGTYGVQVRSGSAAGNNTVCARIENNTTAGGTTAGGTLLSGIGIRKQGTTAGVNTFGIHGLSPSPATSASAETHVTGFNPSSATGANGKRVSSISGSNYEGCNLP